MYLKFLIRRATVADMPQVIQLDFAAFSPYGTTESPKIIRARQQIFPEGFVVAESAGRIVGYGSSEKWPTMREPGLDENPYDTHDSDGSIFCITGMAVAEAYRRQGIGTAMTRRLIHIARAHGCTHVVLETTHAQAFYHRLGFEILTERQERGVRLSIMVKQLQGI